MGTRPVDSCFCRLRWAAAAGAGAAAAAESGAAAAAARRAGTAESTAHRRPLHPSLPTHLCTPTLRATACQQPVCAAAWLSRGWPSPAGRSSRSCRPQLTGTFSGHAASAASLLPCISPCRSAHQLAHRPSCTPHEQLNERELGVRGLRPRHGHDARPHGLPVGPGAPDGRQGGGSRRRCAGEARAVCASTSTTCEPWRRAPGPAALPPSGPSRSLSLGATWWQRRCSCRCSGLRPPGRQPAALTSSPIP